MPTHSAAETEAVIAAHLPVAAADRLRSVAVHLPEALQRLAAPQRLAVVQHLAVLPLRAAVQRSAAAPRRRRAGPPAVLRRRRRALRRRRPVYRCLRPALRLLRSGPRRRRPDHRRRPSDRLLLRAAPVDSPVRRVAAVFPAATLPQREAQAATRRGLRLPLATAAVPAAASRAEISREVKKAAPAGSVVRLRVGRLAVRKLPVVSQHPAVRRHRLRAPRAFPTPLLAATSRTRGVG